MKAAASHSAPVVGQAAGRAVGGATEIAIHAGVEGAVARGYGVVRH